MKAYVRAILAGHTMPKKSRQSPRGRVECKCEECGTWFTVRASAFREGRGKYCNPLCYRKNSQILHKSGPDSPTWKGGYSAAQHHRNFRAKYPEKAACHDEFRRAIRLRQIVRPSQCSACGIGCKPHGHHEDYSKPLNVVWLCGTCHNKLHNERRKQMLSLEVRP